MGGIVCAIRGGPDSQASIHKAINLAKETRVPLHFVYVVNLEFLVPTSRSRTHTIAEELEQMGEFILLAAQAKAAAEGVTAQADIRHGNVLDQILALSQEIEADYDVLGRPRRRNDQDLLTQERLEQFIGRIELLSPAKVVLAEEPDEATEDTDAPDLPEEQREGRDDCP